MSRSNLSFRPNIVWIVTTQWRFSATGYRKDKNARTPHLDELARIATDFVQAVTPHPMGPQARAALLTGRLSPANGVNDYWDALPPQQTTISHFLRQKGYATSFFGKWHLGKRSKLDPLVGEEAAKILISPDSRGGFNFWEGFESGFLLNDPWLHGTRIPQPKLFKGYQADILVQRALEWIDDSSRVPFFCVVSLEGPHPPYGVPALNIQKTDPNSILLRSNVPLGGAIEQRARAELSGYYAHIEATDRCIGKLITELDFNNTIVVFTSVHGDMHGSHGVFRKAWPYEESVRVPLLVSDFLSGNKVRRNESPVSLADLPDMAVAWAEGREWKCGRDSALISMPVAMTIPLQCDRAWRGIRSPRHKLILNADGSPWLYFDLENDPFEMKNLVGESLRTGEVDRMRQLL